MKLQNWAHAAEIFTSIAIVLTLIVLAVELRDNTNALERQYALDSATAVTSPFLYGTQLVSIMEKIKAVDGVNPPTQAFMDNYNLSFTEAETWWRHLLSVWDILEANYLYSGESDDLETNIRVLLLNSDNQIFYQNGRFFNEDFKEYVDHIYEEM